MDTHKLLAKLKQRIDLVILTTVLLAVGVVYACIIPIGYGQDEPVHAYKASSLANGHFFSQKIEPSHTELGTPIMLYGSYVPRAIIDVEGVSYGIKASVKCEENVCTQPTDTQQAKLRVAREKSIAPHDTLLLDFWGVNGYIFIGYIPSAIGFFIAQTLHTHADTAIYLGRLCNLFVAVAIISLAFFTLRHSRLRWILAATALLPATIIAMASIGTDGILDALSLLIIAVVARALTDKKLPKSLQVTLLIAAIIVPLIKLPYVLLSLTALLVKPLFPQKLKGNVYRFAFIFLVLVPGLVWNVVSADMTRSQYLRTHVGSSEPNAPLQIKYILHHPVGFSKAIANMFIQNDPINDMGRVTQQLGVSLPTSLVFASYVPLILAILYASERGRSQEKRLSERAFALLTLAASVLLFIGLATAMYLSYNPVGAHSIHGVQGRYLVPLIPFIGVALALLLNSQLTLSDTTKRLLSVIAVMIPIVSIFCYLSIA